MGYFAENITLSLTIRINRSKFLVSTRNRSPMNATTGNPVLIQKEQVSELRFPSSEVLTSPDEITRRQNELARALVLGNVDHSKVRIIFQDTEGSKMVETTIWAVTELRVVLKSGMVIPINRILEVIT